jgi:hypothetical protein
MKPLKATVIKLEECKYSRTENVYYRIKLRLETGEFAMTDAVPTYRNFHYWKPVIAAGVGTTIAGVYLKEGNWKPLKVNADSQVFIIQETLIKDEQPVGDEPIFQIKNGDPEIWAVLGSKDKRHEVVILHGFAECDCEAFRFAGRKKECKHTKAVEAYRKAKELKQNKQGTLL